METFFLPENASVAYMACHFSPYGNGLSNIPARLPPGAMLILNDRTPICGHDPERIAEQLLDAFGQLHFDCLLLDFEQPDTDAYYDLCPILTQQLPCPVGISDLYAKDLDCPIFLPPAPLDMPLEAYIAPWKGRELWLDIAPQAERVTITESGSSNMPMPFSPPPENAFTDEALHCKYRTEVSEEEIKFFLWRDLPQIEALLEEAQTLGITKSIGLHQELCADK